MCKVTRTKYSCRHHTTTYQTRCASAISGNRCEKTIEPLVSSEKCPKCNPDSRHREIADLYARYGDELAKLAELARRLDCRTMVTQVEGIRRGLAGERIRALEELQGKIEGEEGARRRVEEEAAEEVGW
ncbi:hypothetical protein TgHK011_004086 [Trichoderma gracile]|nr:hypothetical protein TgHK011_004086 [Trichoderma gracile]